MDFLIGRFDRLLVCISLVFNMPEFNDILACRFLWQVRVEWK